MPEAEVIHEVFRMAAKERSSCRVIAARLNELRVPCAYTRDDRLLLRGKRKQTTSGIWEPGRIRGLITNSTYKGVHEYGKRTKSARPVLSRPVVAIVTEDVWQKAQATLKANLLFSARNAKNQYLLRGLMKCSLCGRTYVGTASNRPNGRREFYYRCNGAHTPSLYMAGQRCAAKAVRGDVLEEQVWNDVEAFLRNPEPVLQQLHAKMESDALGSAEILKQVTRLEGLLAQKVDERSRVVSLFRRGRLSDTELDAQMDEIGKEETALEARASELRAKLGHSGSIVTTVRSAETLLAELRKRLDEPVCWELKRNLIEVLVGGIRVETEYDDDRKHGRTTVMYRFSQPDGEMPLILAQAYGAGTVDRATKTVGDHIRRQRMTLKLLQRDVAETLGVTASTVFNWESNTATPDFRVMPAIIEFLGFNPVPEPDSAGARLVWERVSQGLSQREAARRMGVDPGTLAKWERGKRAMKDASGA
jgi:site-specific DNA recombinase